MSYTLSSSEKAIMTEFRNHHKKVCHYCKKPISDLINDLTIDHLIPVSRGGKTIPSNLVICCKKCNCDKSDFTEEEYYEFKEKVNSLKETNQTLKDAYETYERYSDVINRDKELNKSIKDIDSKVKSLQDEIMSINFNASLGYQLCKELQI